eukprot:TRINITY_DN5070_c1_g1_i5.p2 TRINITY_DN5070_c1_g1~~TRINITY_DN5070_c1_g1_i5.p2  ORF type:complete len:307 (-),score=34.45 TRINITY_DN5070_c1_g1_i5:386-1306(-)
MALELEDTFSEEQLNYDVGNIICTNIIPDGSDFDCEWLANVGLCDAMFTDGFCLEECGYCCEDKPFATFTCEEFVQAGLCENPDIKDAGYCEESCGVCGTASSSERASNPSPNLPTDFTSQQEVLVNWVGGMIEKTDSNPCNWVGVTCLDQFPVQIFFYGDDIQGTIPAELSELTSLTLLELGQNSLLGTIPPELSSLTSLTYLSMFRNSLSGTIPVQLSVLASLERFFLYVNSLTGSIPPELSELTSLTHLQLGFNDLTGKVPVQLSTLQETDVFLFPQDGDGLCLERSNQRDLDLGDFFTIVYC